QLLQFTAIEAKLHHDAWTEIFYQHIGARDEIGQHPFALVALQVNHDRALAAVHRNERGREIALGRTNAPANITIRAFYLYDVRTLVGEQGGGHWARVDGG